MSAHAIKQSSRSGHRLLMLTTIAVGAALRIGLFATTPPQLAYDNHIEVALYHVEHGRLPEPDELWQAYHPPLYHLLGSTLYRLVAGSTVTDGQWVARQAEQRYGLDTALAFMAASDANPKALPAQPDLARRLQRHRAGLKTIQGISLAAGIGTLLLCWAALARLLPTAPLGQWVGLLVAGLLPRHIYMSAMATNDSLCYFFVTASVYLLIGFLQRPTWFLCAACGVTSGLALLSKSTALAILPAAVIALTAELILQSQRRTGAASRLFRQCVTMLALAAAIGVWPYARLASRYGNPFISNVALLPRTGMTLQPPGPHRVRWACLPIRQLWARPFIHRSTVDCWPAAIYARMWFDYEPWFTQWRYPPFKAFYKTCQARVAQSGGNVWDHLLNWPAELSPPQLTWQGRALYLAGLPITLLIASGLIALGRRNRQPVYLLLLSLFVFAVLIVLAQSIRLPYFSSFKAAFLLTSLLPLCAWAGIGADAIGRALRRPGQATALAACLFLAAAATVHFGYLCIRYANRRALWSGPTFAAAHYRQARDFQAQGDIDQAIAFYRIAAQLNPAWSEPWIQLGQLQLARHRPEQAAESFARALESSPEAVQAYTGLAGAHVAQNRFDRAIHALRRGLQHAPKDPTLSNALAWLLATCPQPDLQDAPEALRLARSAAEATKYQNPYILHTLAVACAQAGDRNQARALAEEALSLARATGQLELAERIQQDYQRYVVPPPVQQ